MAHVPKFDWQPSPQYAEVEPQKPFDEQQLPKVEVRHVAPVAELLPQFPSMLVGRERSAKEIGRLGALVKMNDIRKEACYEIE